LKSVIEKRQQAAALQRANGWADQQFRWLAICTGALAACFAKPLYDLARLGFHSELYSHVFLIPLVSLYLAWLKQEQLQSKIENQKSKIAPSLFLAAGALSAAASLALGSQLRLAPVDALSWNMLSFFLLFVAACGFCLDAPRLRLLAFPIGFMIFLVPFPVAVRDGIEAFLQHTSADAAAMFFSLVGTPYVRQDVAFQLPGFSLQVAPECSGIRSSLVLFITSLVAGQLFLRRPWKRWLFALAVVPLGILRNGFRIVTIGELCVQIDPNFINSPIHHRGGPVFFVISMAPFLLLLWWLRKSEKLKVESRKQK
jgi:exosortase C (VPDSG-CTERM-specific)